MFVKLLLIIVATGATACALLVNRQHRIDTAHEIAAVHQRLIAQEQTVWRLRSEVARHVRPESIRRRIEAAGGVWVSVPSRPPARVRPAVTVALHGWEPIDDEEFGG